MTNPTIFDLADAFLSIESMSNKKLQKMCYYAKAWHLALGDGNIIDDAFEAWVHGPVNPDLYNKYKDYGFNSIPKYKNKTSLPVDIVAFAEKVYEAYGHLDAYDLECLVRSEPPYIEARGDLQPYKNCENIISESSMMEYYRTLIN